MDHREVCDLLQQTVLDFCRQNVSSWYSDIEVDGIICISPKNSSTHHVVKIHERLQPMVPDQEMQGGFQQCDMKSRHGDPLNLNVNVKQNIVDEPCRNINGKTKSPEQIKDVMPNVSEMLNGDVAIVSLESSIEPEDKNCSEYYEDGHFSNEDARKTDCLVNKFQKCETRKQDMKLPLSNFLPKTNEYKRNPVTQSHLTRTENFFQSGDTNISDKSIEDISQNWNATENTASEFTEETFVIKKETTESTEFDIHSAQSDNTSLIMNNFSKPTFLPNSIHNTNSYQFSPVISRELKHSCRFCGKQFSFKCTKVRHERNSCGRNVQTLYTCEMCEKVFSRSDSRGRHMIKAHGMMSANALARKNKTC